MFANFITLSRVVLIFVAVGVLYTRSVWGALTAFALVLIAITMDWMDGFIARRTHSESIFGAVVDILGDRIVENTLWIVFADLELVPVWVPIVVVTRGFVTDAFRSLALTQGETPFGEKTMIKSHLGRLLVSSRGSRALYAGAKIVAFCLMILYFASLQCPAPCEAAVGNFVVLIPDHGLYSFSLGLVYVTVALCLIRALPVVRDGMAQVKELRTVPLD